MKKVLGVLLTVVLIASFASAELLTTANPIGQGKWAVLGAYSQDSDYLKPLLAGLTLTTMGGYVGYGATDKFDVYLQLGSANVGGLPAGVSASATGYGLNLKYAVIAEGKELPVSVAVGGGYKSTTSKVTGQADQSGNVMSLGVGVSKLMVPFIPYGGLTYKKTTSAGTDVSSQLDLTLGSAIAWSTQGAVFAEYTMQSITPNGGTVYTSGQMALGVGYSI